MSEYTDKIVKTVNGKPGHLLIEEKSGKKLEIIYKDGQRAFEVIAVQTNLDGSLQKLTVSPRSRNCTVYGFNRDSVTAARGTRFTSIGVIIGEAEAVLNGSYSSDLEYNHKLRVKFMQVYDLEERVGSRGGELLTHRRNCHHSTTTDTVLEETGLIISVGEYSKLHELLKNKPIKDSDVLALKHVVHHENGITWYEILE